MRLLLIIASLISFQLIELDTKYHQPYITSWGFIIILVILGILSIIVTSKIFGG